jgi:hypothetical protein
MLAHTKCACTRASLHQLARLMANLETGQVDAFVVFVGPLDDERSLDDLRATARAIPGVRVTEDAAEAQAFGARTSGQVLLFDAGGSVLFRGGITPARGHEGDSRGRDTVQHLLAAQPASPPSAHPTPIASSDVFGCSLFAPEPQR